MGWIWNRFRCLSVLGLTAVCLLAQASQVELIDGMFVFQGWNGGPHPPVFAGDARTPMLGTYTVERGILLFHPRFPVAPGTRYQGTFRGVHFAIEVPRRQTAATHVEHVYPSADLLPTNTLKLYICFSAPVTVGDASKHFRLLDERGQPLPDAFLDQELWDGEHRRLTVLLDPGRIKRGLAPHREAGSPIVEGHRYTLAIDRDWKDANGMALAESFHKDFTGAPADRTTPAVRTWRLAIPKAGTRDALAVRFPGPMDYALLQHALAVLNVPGAVTITANETEWRFTPDLPWRAGDYSVLAEPTLEDYAGNRPDRLFDVDLRVARHHPQITGCITVPFRIAK